MQNVGLDGAVVVATPHRLSHVDVVKGVEMFHELDVPTLAVVENMSFFECDRGVRYRPFGDGHARELREQFHLDESQLFELPLSAATADANERALPLTLPAPVPDDEVDAATAAPAGTERAVSTRRRAASSRTCTDASTASIDRASCLARHALSTSTAEGSSCVFSRMTSRASTRYLRSSCGCATHELAVSSATTRRRMRACRKTWKPKKITPKGSYGHAIEWSDGHKGVIYRNEALLWAARDAAGDV